MAGRESAARDALEVDRDLTTRHVREAGGNATLLRYLRAAARDLEVRLEAIAPTLRGSFTEAQMKAALEQVRASARVAARGIRDAAVKEGVDGAMGRASRVLGYLEKADAAFRGVGSSPLALNHARLMDRAVSGAGASILGRLGESGTGARGAARDPHRARPGILDRYGTATVKSFEGEMVKGLLARKSFDEVADDVTRKSPFLKAAPRFWAERIVRTECLTGDAVVVDAVVRAAFRRWYEGPIAKIVTHGGRVLTATPNHPMLTRHSWVEAGALKPGDDLICHRGKHDHLSSRDEHVQRGPSSIREVFDAVSAVGIRERRRTTEPDFHGDGMDGEVDVARPLRALSIGSFAALYEPTLQHVFAPTDGAHATLCAACGRLLSIQKQPCLCWIANDDPSPLQAVADRGPFEAEIFADALRALSSLVALNDLLAGHGVVERWGKTAAIEEAMACLRERTTGDGRAFEDALHCVIGDASPRADGRGAQPGEIEFDRVRALEIVDFKGHVFNLETEDGYYVANGAYTGNTMAASNRAGLEAIVGIDAQEGGGQFAKILSATFDDRTGWDSYMVHGQIRRPGEAFEWRDYRGRAEEYMAPPNRPNDREIVVPHATRWVIPESLRWLPASEYRRVFREQAGKKRSPPARPRMTTIPLSAFASK